MTHASIPPEVQQAVTDALGRIRAAGKAAGILTSDRDLARGYVGMGAEFVAVGSDVGVLRAALKELRGAFQKVVTRKPGASRARSREVYLLAQGFKG